MTMNISSNEQGDLTLEAKSDAELKTLRGEIDHILKERRTAREKQALAEIRRLAKEHGLSVAVKRPARKRGRPRKDSSENGYQS